MKKAFFLIVTLLTLFFIPKVVDAEGHCRVVSGNGNDLGSEIDCGGEHFYVFDKDDSNLKLLAKYNIFDGNEYDHVVIPGCYPGYSNNEKAQELLNLGYSEKKAAYDFQKNETDYTFYKEMEITYKKIQLDGTPRTYREILYLPEVIDAIQNEGFIPQSTVSITLGYSTREVINGEYYYDATYIELYKNDSYTTEIHMAEDSSHSLNIYEIQSSEEYQQKIAEGYSFEYSELEDTKYSVIYYYGYYYKKRNESKIVKQSELAIGAHGAVRGVAELPEYGSFTANPLGQGSFDSNSSYNDNNYRDVILDYSYDQKMTNSLLFYKRYLESLNVGISDINLITVKDLDNFTYNTTNNRLPLDDWTSNWQQGNHFGANFNIIGSLKDHIPDDYSWIWATTYWTRTRDSGSNAFFVDSWGDICNAYYCSVDVGAGLRPVITVAKNEILYNIAAETDNNGEIEVVDNSAGNETISFKVSPKKGYKLSTITITTENGTTIEFTEGDLIENEDGTVTIMNNKFVMPFENVTITANWKIDEVLDNPATDDEIAKYCFILFISFGTLLTINRKCHKKAKNN